MKSEHFYKKTFITGVLGLLIAVILGAFGAHALELTLTEKYIATFKTGVSYQFYHSFALILIGLFSYIYKVHFQSSYYFYLFGLFFFSLNCYLYAITQFKFFAYLIPLGGISFIVGHIMTLIKLTNQKQG